jgi:hypothetical protein
VFSGTGWEVDTGKSVEELIGERILRNYEPLHQSITRYTHNNPVNRKSIKVDRMRVF